MTCTRTVPVGFQYLSAALVILAATGLYGQNHEDAVKPFWGVSATGGRASGLAQAFTGIADDATAITFNPAGLAHLTAGEFNISLGHLNSTTVVTDSTNRSSTSITATRLGNLGLAMPIPGSRLTLAVAYQQLRAYDRRWKIGGDSLAPTWNITEKGSLGAFSLGMAYQVSMKLAVGGAVDYLTGNDDYTENVTYPTQPDSSDFAIFNPNYSGINLALGLLLAPIPQWRIGLMIRTPQKINISEDYTDISINETYEYSSRSSYYLRAGTSLSVRTLLVAADIYWFDYSQIEFKSDPVIYEWDLITPIDIGINDTLRAYYKGIVGWAVGGELLLPGYNLKLRGGYRLDPAFYPSNGYDANQRTIALGFSLVPVPALKLDFTYTRTTWENNSNESLTAGNLALGLAYRL